jgi:NADP-dependent 3-hydroxy acid dehydrogenase YdfG
LDRLQSLARRIEGAGGEVAYAQTDVRKREDLTSLVNLACER